LTATFFVWDDFNNVWVDKSTLPANPAYPFTAFVRVDDDTVSAYHIAGTLTIYQTSSAWIPEKIYKVKISITDLQSSDPIANHIEHTFLVDVYHACQRNTLSFDSDQTSQLFVMNADPANNPSTTVPISNSAVTADEPETTCILNRFLEIYDPSTQAWIVYTSAISGSYPWITSWTAPVGNLPVYDSSTNSFTVSTSDFTSYDNELIPPSTWKLRMKV